jgi:hypothetical protein
MRFEPTHRTPARRHSIVGLAGAAALALLTACTDSVGPGAEPPAVPRVERKLVSVSPVPARSFAADVIASDLAAGTLVDQTQSLNAVLIGSTPDVHIYMADDFVVGEGRTWTVSSVLLPGYLPSNNPTGLIEIAIHADAGGEPGEPIATYTLTPTSSTQRDPACSFFCIIDHLYQLPSPVVLQPGTYWLRTECSVTYFQCWFESDVTGSISKVLGFDGQTWFDSAFEDDIGFALLGDETVTPDQQVKDLGDVLAGMNLPAGLTNSLRAKLLAAVAAISEGNTAAACSALQAFVNEATAQAGKKLTAQQAADLIAAANAIREELGC